VPDQPDVVDKFFSMGNPNPERTGCPGWEIINQIAEKNLPFDHPARLHLAHCSPCYRAFHYLKEAHRALRSKLPT